MANQQPAHLQDCLNHGNCPSCGSENVDGNVTEVRTDHIFVSRKCSSCDAVWRETYGFLDIVFDGKFYLPEKKK